MAALPALASIWLIPLSFWLGHIPAHMIRHAVLVAVAAPLIVVAFPHFRRLAPNASIAAAIETVVAWGWHLPVLHAWARDSIAATALEQATFLFAGLAVWGGAMAARSGLAGAAALLFTSVHMTMLGVLVILGGRNIYGEGLWAQQLGGVAMLAIVTPAYLIGGLVLMARELSRKEANA